MKVILQKDVQSLGDAGDIKEVAAGYARNYLIPRKLAVLAQAGSTRAALHLKKLAEIKRAKRVQEMQGVALELKSLGEITVAMRVGADRKLFGSVTPHLIAQSLAQKGFTLDKRKIEISEPIKALGVSTIKVKLAEGNTVPLSVKVVAAGEEENVEAAAG